MNVIGTDNKSWGWLAALFLICFLAAATLGRAADDSAQMNALESLDYSTMAGGKTVVKLVFKHDLTQVPGGFSVSTPPRIALDLGNTANALGKNAIEVNSGDLKSMTVVQVGNRTRVVMNLSRAASYESRADGKVLLVTLIGSSDYASPHDVTPKFAEAKPGAGKHAVRDVDFRRGPNGEGRVVVDLSDTGTGIDIRRQGKQLLIDFSNTSVPTGLERKLDVADFGTPVRMVETSTVNGSVRITVEPDGTWEHSAYQTDNQFIVEVKRVTEDPSKLSGNGKPNYIGEKLSLNFQNIEVRSVLQVIADFTGLNIIASDTVTGSITLRLKDVPWDQALDIILQSKNLSMRRTGNVVLVAPTDELATKEKLALEATQQKAELEPLQTESIRLNYQKAEDVQKLLSNDKQKILSKRGSVVVDVRTNTVFVQDTPQQLDEVRRLVNKIDVPVKQVMIEARIVIADDQFSRQLGVRFGTQGGIKLGATNAGTSGNIGDSSNIANGNRPGIPSDPNNLNVNLPVAGAAGSLALTLLNIGHGNLVNLELSALEADKRGKVVSSPRVITADKQRATIEQGTEIPYLQASSSGATNVAFKPAVLSLAVTPRITPEGKVIMDLEVKKDSVGTVFSGVPSIDTKKVVTQILIDDGETAVIGGIYEQTQRNDVDKVPVLGDLPYLGNLFKNTTRSDAKTELLVFITPRVLKDTISAR
jgi:type IV pilus assembly protein PilQ